MPRPERPLDSSDGPVQRFAADLRTLRQEAGNPTYRQLAKEVHFSKATLSSAASGHRLPTWDVTRAYVGACGGDIEQWRQRWSEVRRELGLPESIESGEVKESAQPIATPQASRRRLYAVSAVIAMAALVAIGSWAIQAKQAPSSALPPDTHSSEPTTTARYVGGEDAVVDGADPKRSGCAFDPGVRTLDSIEVTNDDNHFLGVAELRHSPACRVAWGRFTPSEGMGHLEHPTVAIVARRPTTGTDTAYETYFDGQAVFGNILVEDEGCVEITVIIKAPHGGAAVTTNCHR